MLMCVYIQAVSMHTFSLVTQGSALPQIVQTCSATDSYVWLSILFVYKGALLVVGLFLAWETREVHLKHLNDSKLIGASIYGIVVLSVALAAVGILLQSAVNTSYGVIGALLLLGNTSLLCLIFAPKVTLGRVGGGGVSRWGTFL